MRFYRRKVYGRRKYGGNRRRLTRPSAIGNGAYPMSGSPYKATIRGPYRGGAPVRSGPRVRMNVNSLGAITQLLTRTRTDRGSDDGPGTGSVTSFKHKRNNPDYVTARMSKELVGRHQTTYQTSGSVSSTTGCQFPFVLGAILTKNQIQDLKDKMYGAQSTYSLNRTLKLHIKHIVARYFIRNQNNFPVKMRIYMVLATRDSPSTAIDSPVEAWAKAYTDEETNGVDNSTTVGQTPRMSEEFRRYFRILKTHYLDLSPGQYHEHKVFYDVQKMLNTTIIDNLVGQSCRSWTLYCMGCFYGTLANETAVTDQVTFAPARIDYAQTMTTSWAYFTRNQSDIEFKSKFITTTAGLEQMADTGFASAAPGNTD